MYRRGIYYADPLLHVLKRKVVVLRAQLVLLLARIRYIVWPDVLLPYDLADLFDQRIARYLEHLHEFLVIQHDLPAPLSNEDDALGQAHEYGLQLRVHASNLRQADELRFVPQLRLVDRVDHEEHRGRHQGDRDVVEIVVHKCVINETAGDTECQEAGGDQPVGITDYGIDHQVIQSGYTRWHGVKRQASVPRRPENHGKLEHDNEWAMNLDKL